MSRKKPKFIPSSHYILSNIGNTGNAIFTTHEQVDFFIRKFNYHTHGVFRIIAWCILRNQYHFIVKTRSRNKILKSYSEYKRLSDRILSLNSKELSAFLSRVVGDFCNSYAKAYNKSVCRKGSLFRENFRKRLLQDHQELIIAVKALERLPYIEKISGFSNTNIQVELMQKEGIQIEMGFPALIDTIIPIVNNNIITSDTADMQVVKYAKGILME